MAGRILKVSSTFRRSVDKLGISPGRACVRRVRGQNIWLLLASFVDLHAAQRDADRRLVAYCERLADASTDLEVVLVREDGARYPERVGDVLAHLFQHQIHHRGQVHAMLSGTSVPPPQLDEYFLRQDAHVRLPTLAA